MRTHPPNAKGIPNRWAIAILITIVLLFMWPIVRHHFTQWDDNTTVLQNGRINPPSIDGTLYFWSHAYGSLYIPLTYTAWAILAAIARLDTPDAGGVWLNPMVFHAANLLLHVGSAAMVYSILTRLTRHRTTSLIGALFFALHPIQVESVAWISGLKDVMWGFFALAAIDQYVCVAQRDSEPTLGSAVHHSRVSQRLRYATATTCLILAMLSKPSAMVTPAIAVVIDRLLLARPWRKIAWSAGPWLVLVLPAMVVARLAQPGLNVKIGPLWIRPMLALDSLAFYAWKMIWPLNLAPDYGHNPTAVLNSGQLWWTWLIPASVIAIAIGQYRRRPWIAAGCLIFMIGTLPTLGWTTFSFQFLSTTADHYVYVSMMGLGLIIAYALADTVHLRLWTSVCAVLLLVLGVRSCLQTRYWSDSRTLFSHMIAVQPNSFLSQYLLGQTEVDDGNYAAAETPLRRSLELEPRFPKTYNTLATVLTHTGRPQEAIDQLKLFIKNGSGAAELQDQVVQARLTVGLDYLHHNDRARAAEEFRAALKYRPDDQNLKNLLKQAQE